VQLTPKCCHRIYQAWHQDLQLAALLLPPLLLPLLLLPLATLLLLLLLLAEAV
jgi:hypothetical protein